MSVKRFLLRIDKKEYLQPLANGHIFCNRIAKFRKMPTENSKIADSNEGLAKVEEISHITINDLVLNVIGPVRFYYPDYFPIFCAYEFEGISTTKGIQGIVDLSFIEEMKKEKNTSSAIIIEKESVITQPFTLHHIYHFIESINFLWTKLLFVNEFPVVSVLFNSQS